MQKVFLHGDWSGSLKCSFNKNTQTHICILLFLSSRLEDSPTFTTSLEKNMLISGKSWNCRPLGFSPWLELRNSNMQMCALLFYYSKHCLRLPWTFLWYFKSYQKVPETGTASLQWLLLLSTAACGSEGWLDCNGECCFQHHPNRQYLPQWNAPTKIIINK